PAYNAEHFLEATLESVRAQSLRNFICVIVNDGSTDGTQALAARLARRDPRFRVIRHHANSGLSAARNTGLRAAATPYVAFLDADDLLMRNALEIRIAALEADPEEPEVIGAYCASAAIPEGRTQPPLPTARTLPELSFLSVAGDCPFNANQPLFIAEKLRRLGGFNERFAQAEDYEFWARLFRAGYKMRPAHHVAVTYRRRPSSMIRTAPLAHLDIALALNESAHAPLPDWVDFDSDAAPYRQPHGAYRAAMDTARRSLSFAAMEATREVESEPEIKAPSLGLRRRLRETAPLARRLLGEAQARDGALSGVARFYAEPRTGVEERRPAASAAALALLDELDPRQEPPMAAEASAFPLTDRAQFYGWARDDQRAAEILFLPQKDYHLRAIAEIAPFLRAQGVRFEIIDLSSHCGDRGLRGAAAEAGFTLIGLSAFLLGDYRPSLLVAFNEWDPSVRGIFGAAQAAGLRTAAIVEGIQDYRDADIPRRRDAYRMADCVVLPGAFDRRYFSDSAQTVVVGGVPRIDLLRAEPRRAPPDRPLALINANFTYGVLTEHRDAWLEQAAAACDAAGVDWAISRHPADLGALFPERVVSESFYEATARASVVIQRFASGVLEALAMGKPVIYFNPHGERVDKFKEPMGAYPIVETTAALEAELTEIETLTARGEPAWPAFLDAHCAAEGGRGAAETTAAHLIRWRDEADAAGRADWALWRRNLRAVDQFSSALFETHKVLNAVPARYRFGAAPPQPGALDETFAPRLMAKRDAANVLSADLRRATGRFEHALHLVDERIATFYQKSKHWPLIGPALIAVAPLYDRAMGKKKR
ncbi:MAG: glycosyltransferase family A protein, partial [Pseudomonadota bacterium]